MFDVAAWTLTIDLGNGDNINLGNVNVTAIQNFQFADGGSISLDDFMSQFGELIQIDIAGNDYLEGTQFADRLEGLDGNDYLASWEGDDTLIGGTGDDYLYGGYGNDTYIFNRGDGADSIDDSSFGPGQYEGEVLNEVNTLVFGAGITPDSVTHSVNDSGQVVLDMGNGDSVAIGDETDLAIQRIIFSDGAEYSIASILGYQPPIASPIADQVTQQDAQFVFNLPQDSFIESNPGGSLTYSAALINGDALPDWLTFDAATQTFSGSPGNADVGDLALVVTATDLAGLTATSSFNLDVLNVNDAPVVAIPLGNQNSEEGAAFSLAIPSGAFTDPDLIYGDSLTYSATLTGGQPLPDWLVFDPVNLTLSGTAPTGSAGLFDIDIVATDMADASAVNPFQLSITPSAITNCSDGEHDSFENDGNHDFQDDGADQLDSTCSGNAVSCQDTYGLDADPSVSAGPAYIHTPSINWFADPASHSCADLQFAQDANVCEAGSTDPLLNHQILNYDFALPDNSGLTAWNLTDALISEYLTGCDPAALGGELPWQSSFNGSQFGIGLAASRIGVPAQMHRSSLALHAGVSRPG